MIVPTILRAPARIRTFQSVCSPSGVIAGVASGLIFAQLNAITPTKAPTKEIDSVEDVVNAVNNGADTVEKVEEVTGAGSPCGKCRRLIENIIELKR